MLISSGEIDSYLSRKDYVPLLCMMVVCMVYSLSALLTYLLRRGSSFGGLMSNYVIDLDRRKRKRPERSSPKGYIVFYPKPCI